MRIGCDIDGVLADFISGFCDLVLRETGKMIPRVPQSWNWHREAGVTEAEDAALWAMIAASSSWWYLLSLDASITLPVMGYLVGAEMDHDLYFLTWRAGATAKAQTETWLLDVLRLCNPTVLITERKGLAAKALRLDCYIDDRPSYCLDVRRDSPDTRVYLRQAPYNRAEELALIAADVIPVPDILAMLDREGL